LTPWALLVLALAPAEGVADFPGVRTAAAAPALALAAAAGGGVVRALMLAPAVATTPCVLELGAAAGVRMP
jgi:hypothetical protein